MDTARVSLTRKKYFYTTLNEEGRKYTEGSEDARKRWTNEAVFSVDRGLLLSLDSKESTDNQPNSELTYQFRLLDGGDKQSVR